MSDLEQDRQRAFNLAQSAFLEEVGLQQRMQLEQRFAQFRLSSCPLMPSESHCWHDQYQCWDSPFPPPLVCCWCGAEESDAAATPRRHGPHAPTR